jgi:HSP20 family protein
MSLIPYDPFQQLGKVFDRLFSDLPSILGDQQQFDRMQVDVQETGKEVVATIKIPGLTRKEDVKLHVEKDVLSISASIRKMIDVEEENLFRREHYIGKFHRSIALPSPVSRKDMKTSFYQGVLEVRMLKNTDK